MHRKPLPVVLFGLLSLLSTVAVADPSYKARDVVEYLLKTRGLCFQDDVKCNGMGKTPTVEAQPAAGFDLVVTFDYNSDTLSKKTRENLDEFAKAINNPQLVQYKFFIEGHTDARGGDRYNVDLSERRASAVVRYLTELGIDSSRLNPLGLGESKPRAPDPYDAANRRVETRIQ